MTKPICKCHGVAMISRGDARPNGWRCRVKQLEAQRRYYRRHRQDCIARVARQKMKVLGYRGSWMNVLRIERVSEVLDGT